MDLIELLNRTVHFADPTTILDFGCGTGNYLDQIQRLYGPKCYGVEPSESMRERAAMKNAACIVKAGNHLHVPFPDDHFDFVYMTDVIHHVPDRPRMFEELGRVIKASGRLCVVTQSHAQIESRFYNRYFPSLAQIERRRYPDVPDLIREGEVAQFRPEKVDIKPYAATDTVTAAFIQTVEEKNFSMFRLLNDEEHAMGLAQLKNDLGRVYETPDSGQSLVWFERMM